MCARSGITLHFLMFNRNKEIRPITPKIRCKSFAIETSRTISARSSAYMKMSHCGTTVPINCIRQCVALAYELPLMGQCEEDGSTG